jgi:hypothetical protein
MVKQLAALRYSRFASFGALSITPMLRSEAGLTSALSPKSDSTDHARFAP